VIEAESDEETLDSFVSAIQAELPPLARIEKLISVEIQAGASVGPQGEDHFTIRQSTAVAGHFALVPSDVATCTDCFRDFTDASNRRYCYPFTNCTKLRPALHHHSRRPLRSSQDHDGRVSDVSSMPGRIRRPLNRRFHAEPNACPECGPGLTLLSAEQMSSGVALKFTAAPSVRKFCNELAAFLRK